MALEPKLKHADRLSKMSKKFHADNMEAAANEIKSKLPKAIERMEELAATGVSNIFVSPTEDADLYKLTISEKGAEALKEEGFYLDKHRGMTVIYFEDPNPKPPEPVVPEPEPVVVAPIEPAPAAPSPNRGAVVKEAIVDVKPVKP